LIGSIGGSTGGSAEPHAQATTPAPACVVLESRKKVQESELGSCTFSQSSFACQISKSVQLLSHQ
jgi:hypothetical protein